MKTHDLDCTALDDKSAQGFPDPRRAVLVFLGYLLVFYGVWVMTGIKYEHIGDDASTLLRWYVAPLAAAAVYLIVVVGWLGCGVRCCARSCEDRAGRPSRPCCWCSWPGRSCCRSPCSSTTTMMFVYGVLGSIGVGFGEKWLREVSCSRASGAR